MNGTIKAIDRAHLKSATIELTRGRYDYYKFGIIRRIYCTRAVKMEQISHRTINTADKFEMYRCPRPNSMLRVA